MRVRCIDLAGATIDSVTADAGVTTVRGTVVRTEWLRTAPGSRRVVTKHPVLTLVEEGGEWRLSGLSLAEELLARQLVEHPETRETLLRAQPELVNDDLAEALYAAGIESVNAAKPAQLKTVALLAGRVAEIVGDRYSQSRALLIAARIPNAGDAKEQTERALSMAKEDGDADGQARALAALGGLTAGVASLPYYEQVLALEDRLEDRATLSQALNFIGVSKMRLNDHAASMSAHLRAMRVAEEVDDYAEVMAAELATSSLLQRLNDYELSLVHLRHAQDVGAGHPGNDFAMTQVLIFIGVAQSHQHRLEEAKAALKKALVMADRSESAMLRAQAHDTLGDVYLQERNYPEAIKEMEEALAIAQTAGRPGLLPQINNSLAVTKLEAGDARGAIAAADRCAAGAQRLNMDVVQFECRVIAGKAHRSLGETDAALAGFRDAIAVFEELRDAVLGGPAQRANFLERAKVPYGGAADFLAAAGDVEGSLAMAERLKARMLLDALHTDHPTQPLTPAEQKREDDSTGRLTALNRQLRAEKSKPSPDAGAVAKLTADITAARAAYDALQVELEVAHPRRKARQGAVPLTRIDELVPLLGSSLAVIEYLVGDDHTRAFVVTGDGAHAHVVMVSLPVGSADLETRVTSFADSLEQRTLDDEPDARALYRSLLQPLEAALGGRKALCIIPDGALWHLPFETLIDSRGRFVVESRSTFYAPSLSVLAEVTRPGRRPKAPEMLLAVGNPTVGSATESAMRSRYRSADFGPLREAQKEVGELRTLYGPRHSRVLVGAEATKGVVKSEMEKYRILHFATHGILDEQNPLYSQIVFAQSADPNDDGLLGAAEIMGLDLHADLAVLSACETARGRVAAGEGIIGFTWALFVGGCPSSVVSEWKVDSAGTRRLMVEFHRHLLASKGAPMATSDALRAAKLDLLRHSQWRHPFYWSPFVLIGSPQPPR